MLTSPLGGFKVPYREARRRSCLDIYSLLLVLSTTLGVHTPQPHLPCLQHPCAPLRCAPLALLICMLETHPHLLCAPPSPTHATFITPAHAVAVVEHGSGAVRKGLHTFSALSVFHITLLRLNFKKGFI